MIDTNQTISRDPSRDEWSDWLLHNRQAGDPAYTAHVRDTVLRFVDRVLDMAEPAPGMTLADIGTGEGVLAFRALDRVPSLRVILTDISDPMLRHAEAEAESRGVRGQCRFVACPADRLSGIDDSSVDIAATRAVLAYVADKPAAFRELYRVLKPGGRISLAEPILQDEAYIAAALRSRVEADGGRDPFLPLLHRWKSAQVPDTEAERLRHPLVNFSERDLVSMAAGAGFTGVHLELHIDIQPSPVTSWDVFLDIAPHPWAPTLRTILNDRFTPEKRVLFESVYRPHVESGGETVTNRIAYLTATKPANSR